MLWHISVTGRDDVPATEVSAKISLTCDVAQSFTIYMPLLVSRLSRTPPDYLTDVLGCSECTIRACSVKHNTSGERRRREQASGMEIGHTLKEVIDSRSDLYA